MNLIEFQTLFQRKDIIRQGFLSLLQTHKNHTFIFQRSHPNYQYHEDKQITSSYHSEKLHSILPL